MHHTDIHPKYTVCTKARLTIWPSNVHRMSVSSSTASSRPEKIRSTCIQESSDRSSNRSQCFYCVIFIKLSSKCSRLKLTYFPITNCYTLNDLNSTLQLSHCFCSSRAWAWCCEFSFWGCHLKNTVTASAGLQSHLRAQGERNMLPRSFGHWQSSVLWAFEWSPHPWVAVASRCSQFLTGFWPNVTMTSLPCESPQYG